VSANTSDRWEDDSCRRIRSMVFATVVRATSHSVRATPPARERGVLRATGASGLGVRALYATVSYRWHRRDAEPRSSLVLSVNHACQGQNPQTLYWAFTHHDRVEHEYTHTPL
jgi:hypothetical protein